MDKENLNLIFTGISSASALSVTILAIWGAFFTSLPEKLISEYNTEIRSIKEELTVLRHEKHESLKDNAKLYTSNIKLETTNSALRATLNELKNEYSTLQTEVTNFKDKESFRLNYQYRLLATNYLGIIRNKLKTRKRDALYLSNFQKIKDWLAIEPESYIIEKKDNAIITHDNYKEWSEWRKRQPYDIRLAFSLNNEDETPEAHRKYINEIFMKEQYEIYSTALEFAASNLKHNEVEGLAYNNLKNRVNKYIKNNKKQLNIHIEPIIYKAFSDDEIINSGKEALKRIETAELLLNDLEVNLLK